MSCNMLSTLAPSNVITEVTEYDVLCGRGGEANNHRGNIRYRALVKQHQNAYLQTKSKKEKALISHSIISTIHSNTPPGRFLKKSVDGLWHEVDEKTALLKTSQALREDAPYIRKTTLKDIENPMNVFHLDNGDYFGYSQYPQKSMEKNIEHSVQHNPHDAFEVTDHDVLFGRGDGPNRHKGNIRYRSLIKKYQTNYLNAKKNKEKGEISKLIVKMIVSDNPRGRFLKKTSSGKWQEVDIKLAITKTSQALREGAPKIRCNPSKSTENIKSSVINKKSEELTFDSCSSPTSQSSIMNIQEQSFFNFGFQLFPEFTRV